MKKADSYHFQKRSSVIIHHINTGILMEINVLIDFFSHS